MALSGDGKTIFVTPSVRYAGMDLFAEPTSFEDPMTDETLTAKVVIQLFIKPGGYQVGPRAIGGVSKIDPNIRDEELKWAIMEPDSTRLFGLLIKLDGEVICKGGTVSVKGLSCEYQEKCRRFKDLLELPDEYFDQNNDNCFCIKCHTARGIKPNTTRGTPAKVYWLPIGWCRIGLKTGTHKETIHLRHIWHIAFHGTRVQNIKSILEAGALVISDKRGKPTVGRLRCGYQEKCRRFKDSLRLSDDFFDSQNDRCFCTKCLVGIGRYQKRGNPARDYGLPVGWCRMGFRMEPRASSLKVKTEWHVAFHGTRKECVKPILECGDLLMPGDVCLGGKQLRESGGHFNDIWKPTEFDTKQIFVSPSVRYAGHECYAKTTRFVDRVTGEEFNAKVVFQLYIKPDSYQVGPQTIGATDEIDPKISNQEIEWSTKQRGATVFYGLLVKLDETG